jgi:hypothetical protein
MKDILLTQVAYVPGFLTNVRRWYYYRDRYCKATEVKERVGRRLVLRQIATRW